MSTSCGENVGFIKHDWFIFYGAELGEEVPRPPVSLVCGVYFNFEHMACGRVVDVSYVPYGLPGVGSEGAVQVTGVFGVGVGCWGCEYHSNVFSGMCLMLIVGSCGSFVVLMYSTYLLMLFSVGLRGWV